MNNNAYPSVGASVEPGKSDSTSEEISSLLLFSFSLESGFVSGFAKPELTHEANNFVSAVITSLPSSK